MKGGPGPKASFRLTVVIKGSTELCLCHPSQEGIAHREAKRLQGLELNKGPRDNL